MDEAKSGHQCTHQLARVRPELDKYRGRLHDRPAGAFGWDRICALLAETGSIREVIAFPKTGGGYDPLTGAPAAITPEQRKEAGVDAKPEEKKAE